MTTSQPLSAFDEIRRSVDLVGNKILKVMAGIAALAVLNLLAYLCLTAGPATTEGGKLIVLFLVMGCIWADAYWGWKLLKFVISVSIFLFQRNLLKKAP